MRIISGRLGGRQFDSPNSHRTHPMSEKARGALFNTMGDISGMTVLDAFAGSGALSFEAISRGAAYATAIEVDKFAHHTIAENIKKLALNEQVKAIRANCASWSELNSTKLFDIVLLDPPYDGEQRKDSQLLKMISHVKPGGLLIVSYPPRHPGLHLDMAEATVFTEQIHKRYGDAELHFYRRNS